MNLTLVIELAVFMHASLGIELWLRYGWFPLINFYEYAQMPIVQVTSYDVDVLLSLRHLINKLMVNFYSVNY